MASVTSKPDLISASAPVVKAAGGEKDDQYICRWVNRHINWSWYMTAREVCATFDQIRWTSIATIWQGQKKLMNAIYGIKPVKQMTKGDMAFAQFAVSGDPSPELYNKGSGFYGKNPVLEGAFTYMRMGEEFDDHVEETAGADFERRKMEIADPDLIPIV